MKIVSLKENKNIEKRIAITPEIAKKYLELGFEVFINKDYGNHLGFNDKNYSSIGVKILDSEKDLISNSDMMIQVGLPSDENLSYLRENQILIGALNPFLNKDKIDNLIKKKVKNFSLELLPRITRAQSMDILSSQANLAGYKAVVDSFANFEKAIPMMMTAAGTIPAESLSVGQGLQAYRLLQQLNEWDPLYLRLMLEWRLKNKLKFRRKIFNCGGFRKFRNRGWLC